MNKENEKEYLGDVKTAFTLVWRYSFARDPTETELCDSDEESHRAVKRLLVRSLQSGDVPVSFTRKADGAYGVLNALDTDHPAFLIDVRKNTFVHGKADECYWSMHLPSLERFLQMKQFDPSHATMADEKECVHLLIQKIRDTQGTVFTKRQFHAYVKLKIPSLPHRMFLRAWRKAIVKTGRYDLNKPGRRPSST